MCILGDTFHIKYCCVGSIVRITFSELASLKLQRGIQSIIVAKKGYRFHCVQGMPTIAKNRRQVLVTAFMAGILHELKGGMINYDYFEKTCFFSKCCLQRAE